MDQEVNHPIIFLYFLVVGVSYNNKIGRGPFFGNTVGFYPQDAHIGIQRFRLDL